MTTIITTVIVGAIIGALARLVMPGKQNISVLMTILLGALGALVGSWLLSLVFNYNNSSGGIAWWGVVAGTVMAAIFISIYLSLRGRSRTRV
ncbi:GlsB/YeaQ/YmgE family stress response membrane protein [Agilicoccus flavus]|uniref:GlsB/YeaQ/YmgE family stress response membrane protein n=1 Tax=Agilicoccus flavus TaxID=2775968 RepID=UPI001CF6D584|nr:GlsB/YeaQ/YmgE family stress response membrane protein [Agilicoccus flavus]